MVLCFAACCNHRTVKNNCSFFRFPKNKKLRALWTDMSRRADREPNDDSRLCSCHFKDGKKENNPTIFRERKQFDFPSAEAKTKKKKKVFRRDRNHSAFHTSDSAILEFENQELHKTVVLNLRGALPWGGVEEFQGMQISGVGNVVDQEIENENSENISALEHMEEISGVENVVVKQEIEIEDGANISSLEQLRESLLKDELQQTQLKQAYTIMSALGAEKDALKQSLDAAEVAQNSLFTIVFNKDSELSKVKKELQQAYSEINALRREKEEMAERIADTDFTQSILQNQEKLRFYTGLNSVKDFQSVLSLLPPDEKKSRISFDTKVLIVLIKLKLNLFYGDLGYRFNMSGNTVKSICDAFIPPLETKLESMLENPINKALRRNIPHSFKNSVYENLYQRLKRFFKTKNKEDENDEPDL